MDFEEVIPQAENYGQRISRKRFYLKNGFKETGFYSILAGERYEIVCSEGILDVKVLRGLLYAIHQIREDFQPELQGAM